MVERGKGRGGAQRAVGDRGKENGKYALCRWPSAGCVLVRLCCGHVKFEGAAQNRSLSDRGRCQFCGFPQLCGYHGITSALGWWRLPVYSGAMEIGAGGFSRIIDRGHNKRV